MQVNVMIKKKLKDILESDLLSTPEGVTDNSPNVPMTSTQFRKPSARKSLCLFTKILDVKPKTANVVLWLQNPNAKP